MAMIQDLQMHRPMHMRCDAVAFAPTRQRRGEGDVFAGTGARAPGRSRTDTGDPFRGPASSLGLRGLGHDTPVSPNHSCSAEWGVESFTAVQASNSADPVH